MSEMDSLQAAKEMYAAFGRGDLPGLLNLFADDVDWQSPPGDFPISGKRQGRDDVAKLFGIIIETLDVQVFEPRQFITEGNSTVVIGFDRSVVKATGVSYETEWVQVFTVAGGKVVKFREYYDTAVIVDAYKGKGR